MSSSLLSKSLQLGARAGSFSYPLVSSSSSLLPTNSSSILSRATRIPTISQVCLLRDIDYFGFKITSPYLGETMKKQRIPAVAGVSNLKTRVHRMRQRVPVEMDLCKFAESTLTERRHAVDLPEEYSVEPMRKRQMSGRDPNTGRIAVHHRGGGKTKYFYWMDFNRLGPSEEGPLEEQVLWTGRSLDRSGYIALVCNGVDKRYVLAHEGLRVGDVIRSTREMSDRQGVYKNGDAYPIGGLPVGTVISQIEIYPRRGATYCRAAGSAATIVAHLDHDQQNNSSSSSRMTVVELGTNRQIVISQQCMVVVGRLERSGPKREKIGNAVRKRWMGIRPQSGLKKKKTGRFGRKLHKKLRKVVYDPDKPVPLYIGKPPLACRR